MVALVIEERHTAAAIALIDGWIDEGSVPNAPLLARYEFISALTKRRAKGEITDAKVRSGLAVLESLVVKYDFWSNPTRVIEIALEMGRHRSNDAVYLELAERLDAELWTIDRPLARNPASGSRVRLID